MEHKNRLEWLRTQSQRTAGTDQLIQSAVQRAALSPIITRWIQHDIVNNGRKIIGVLVRYAEYAAHGSPDGLITELELLRVGLLRTTTTIEYLIQAIRDGEHTKLSDILADLKSRRERLQLSVEVNVHEDVEIPLDRAVLLKIALDNLLDNATRAATRASPAAETMHIGYEIDHTERVITLTVRNGGVIDTTWTSDDHGGKTTGLGLVVDCVQYYDGGRVFEPVIDPETRQVTVTVRFPYDMKAGNEAEDPHP